MIEIFCKVIENYLQYSNEGFIFGGYARLHFFFWGLNVHQMFFLWALVNEQLFSQYKEVKMRKYPPFIAITVVSNHLLANVDGEDASLPDNN